MACSRQAPSVPEVLAHQGGWDEMLFVAVPLALFAGLLFLARRRAEAEARDEEQDPIDG